MYLIFTAEIWHGHVYSAGRGYSTALDKPMVPVSHTLSTVCFGMRKMGRLLTHSLQLNIVCGC